jgi:hypothetical protein
MDAKKKEKIKATIAKLYKLYEEKGAFSEDCKESSLILLPTLREKLTNPEEFDPETIKYTKVLIEAIQEQFVDF